MEQLKTILAALLLLCSTVATAHDFNVGGIYYNITDAKSVEVTYCDPPRSDDDYSGHVTIPANVTFNGTTYSVTAIGGGAFNNSSSLTSIEIPGSVTTIGHAAFGKCNSLTSITVDENNPVYDSRDNCNAIIETASNTLISGCKNTVIPGSVTTIGYAAFGECKSLTSIKIPNSVTTIGDDAFYWCSSLASIEIPNSVTTIGEYAFSGCYALKNVTIGNSVTTIGMRTFNYCVSLTSVVIGNSVTTIGECAFTGCTSLTNIEIPGSVTNIGKSAFTDCTSLTSIEIPNSVTTIGGWAFNECSSLTSIEIPNSVTNIGEWAFKGCWSLTSITSHIPAEKLFIPGSDAFYEVNKTNCTLYVPYGAKETYAATSVWSEFTNIVELPAEAFNLTVSAAKYATLYLDYNAIIPQGVEVYAASSVDGNRLMMQEVTGTLPANTGVIVRAEQGTYTFEESTETVGAIEGNLFRGSVEDIYITPAKEAKYYVLSMKDGVVGMYEDALSGGTFKNNAHKAYLVLGEKNLGIYDEEVDTEEPGMQLSNRYYFDFGGTTAIDPVVTEVNDNIYYDLSGRRVENPTQGIYIVNGKKVLVK
ncbi:MAG: leucine-rich repeat domain-containing protein [Bacteroidaceae bacterium]|nr:leucine-rich repeat domain-containing protein [Bacteroidaceae bacterium]